MIPKQNSLAVRLESVEKWFGHISALQKVNFTVQQGQFIVLLGRNGAGKSTLLKVIARLVRPNSGTVEVCGFDIRREPEQVRRRLGFVGHSSYLYRNLTARENLRFFARLYQLDFVESGIQQALQWVGLEHEGDRPILGFSRGMQQRLSIARATLHKPEVLLVDEPFSGLDLEAAELLAGWMKEFVDSGKTIVMATHDLEQGGQGVDRWLLLEKGRIVKELGGDQPDVRAWYKGFLKRGHSELS